MESGKSMPRVGRWDNTRVGRFSLPARGARRQPWAVGRHYPDLVSDPVPTPGYFYAPRYRKLARLRMGDRLPRHMGPWEFVAPLDDGSSSEILQRLLDKYPDLDPYRLTYATSTPVDPLHLVRGRGRRKWSYGLLFALTLGLGWLVFSGAWRAQRG